MIEKLAKYIIRHSKKRGINVDFSIFQFSLSVNYANISKITLRYKLSFMRVAKFKKYNINFCGRGSSEIDTLNHC